MQMVDFKLLVVANCFQPPSTQRTFFCKTIIDVQVDYNHDNDNDDSDDDNYDSDDDNHYNEDDSDDNLQGDCRQTSGGRG